jgi:uncharacterized protein (DUF2147 family)
MKQLFLTALLLITTISFSQSVVGEWETYDDDSGQLKSKVRIYKKDGKVYGKILELYNVEVDIDNPTCIYCTDYRKDQPVKGMEIMTGFTKDGEEWSADDALLDPKNGEVYDGKIWLVSDNKLAVRGYIGWFYRTQYWNRVK